MKRLRYQRACDDGEAIEQSVIDAALTGISRKVLVFEPALERLYNQTSNGWRVSHYRVWLWSMAVVNTPTVLVAAQAEPAHLHLALLLQWGVIVPACLAGGYLLRLMSPLWQIILIAVINTFIVLMLCLLGSLAVEPYTSRYFMTAGIDMMFATIVIPTNWRVSVLAAMPPALVFLVISLSGFGGYTLLHNAAVVGFVLMLILFSLRVRHGMDKISRRSFLLGLRDQLLVNELRRANEQLAAIAATDGLTGVSNRRFFDAALERCWQAAVDTGSPLSVIMVDIDYFKTLNDTAGHSSGDECLRQVAHTIGSSVRAGVDMVARYGGEEFAVILPNASLGDAKQVAERVRRAVAEARILHIGKPEVPSGHGIITVSIGVAQAILQDNTGPQLVLKHADTALYSAKVAGRNRIVLAGQ